MADTTNAPAGATAAEATPPYAVVRCSGKQYTVKPGGRVLVDKLDVEPGSDVTLSEVVFLSGPGGEKRLGTPVLDGAAVTARVLGHRKQKKIRVFKKRRRQGYHKMQGHRQEMTELLIGDITA